MAAMKPLDFSQTRKMMPRNSSSSWNAENTRGINERYVCGLLSSLEIVSPLMNTDAKLKMRMKKKEYRSDRAKPFPWTPTSLKEKNFLAIIRLATIAIEKIRILIHPDSSTGSWYLRKMKPWIEAGTAKTEKERMVIQSVRLVMRLIIFFICTCTGACSSRYNKDYHVTTF